MTTPTDASTLIIEHLADALIYAGTDGLIAGWNKAATGLFGYGADETIGQSLDIIIPERLRAAHWKGYDAAIETGKTRLSGKPTVTKAIHKDGHSIYVEMTFALVLDANGKAMGSVAVARDVTERVERERNARAQPGSQ
nr:PAS domain S-box protein [uncultured Cupriavidus sp.]